MFFRLKEKIRAWSIMHADSKHGRFWLAFLAFTDACCSPIPPDILLVPMLIIKRSQWLLMSLIAAGWSVLGGVFGYAIGFFLFDTVGQWLISTYSLQEQFIQVGDLFNQHAFLTTFVGAFTPFPYKVFALSGGFFNISFLIFLLASIAGRFSRYFIIAFLVNTFGEKVFNFISRKVSLILWLILIASILFVVFYFFL